MGEARPREDQGCPQGHIVSLWQYGASIQSSIVPSRLCVWPRICASLQGRPLPLTILSVEADFSPVLLMALKGLVQPLQGWFTSLWTIEETAAAGFLHDLSAAVACELAESVRAVDNGKAPWALCVGQQEVAVCEKKRSRLGQGQEGILASR